MRLRPASHKCEVAEMTRRHGSSATPKTQVFGFTNHTLEIRIKRRLTTRETKFHNAKRCCLVQDP